MDEVNGLIDLSKTASETGILIIIGCLFIITTLINNSQSNRRFNKMFDKLLANDKSEKKEFSELLNKISENLQETSSYLSTLEAQNEKKIVEMIDVSRSKIIFKLLFDSFLRDLLERAYRVKTENNIDDKAATITKINLSVSNSYLKYKEQLNGFSIIKLDKKLSDLFSDKYLTQIKDLISKELYKKGGLSLTKLDSKLYSLLESQKTDIFSFMSNYE